MCRSQTLLPPTVIALVGRSLQVAVSPCWEWDLPDVISANLSPRAWTPTPAAPVVLLPVSSHKTSAFPTLGTGRRLAGFPCGDFCTEALTGLQSFTNVQARGFARHPDRSYRGVRLYGQLLVKIALGSGVRFPHLSLWPSVRLP